MSLYTYIYIYINRIVYDFLFYKVYFGTDLILNNSNVRTFLVDCNI